ncbi:hypothetical protein AKJ16_DCAP00804 [Drosera capensis]
MAFHFGCKIQTFYNGLTPTSRATIDNAARGALKKKTPGESYELIDEIATNSFQWNTQRYQPKKVAGISETNPLAPASSLLYPQQSRLSQPFSAFASSSQPDAASSSVSHNRTSCRPQGCKQRQILSLKYASGENLGKWRITPPVVAAYDLLRVNSQI